MVTIAHDAEESPKARQKGRTGAGCGAALQRELAAWETDVPAPPECINLQNVPELSTNTVKDALFRSRIDNPGSLNRVPSPSIRRVIGPEEWLDDAGDVYYRTSKLRDAGLVKIGDLDDDLHSHSRMSGLILTKEGWQVVVESSTGIWAEPSETVQELRDEVAKLQEELQAVVHTEWDTIKNDPTTEYQIRKTLYGTSDG